MTTPIGRPEPATDEQFRLLVQSVRDYAIFLLDSTGHVASWNEGAERIKGYKAGEILGCHFSEFYPRAVRESGWPDYELKMAAEEGRFEDEGWRVRKDGSLFWANVVITAVRDEAGVLRGFAKVTRDLTERKAAEEGLRQSEERYRMLVDAVRDYAIFMLDPNGFVITWNSGAQRLKGYRAEEILGQHFSVFYPPERAASGFPQQELEIARTEGRFEEENWRVRKDGSRFWANVVLTAIFDRNGVLRGFSKVTRDISERRRLELAREELTGQLNARVEELGATNRALADKSQEMESFVYGVSHDVRGPLVNMFGFNREIQRSCAELMALLDRNPALPADLREQAQRILGRDVCESTEFMETAVDHLSRIVDSLLRLSRLGRVVYQGGVADISEIVRRILRSLQGTIDGCQAEVTVHDLPPVWADAATMEQIFSNLIANALTYRSPDRPCRIEIGGTADAARHTVEYYVRDNGLGIPRSAIPKLFTAFHRFHPEVARGEGMGLAMVRRIIERHQGKISVESKLGEGSTFYIELPNTERPL